MWKTGSIGPIRLHFEITERVVSETAGSGIVEAGATARLIVLGSGTALLGVHLIGSTTSHVVTHARTPVLVWRGNIAGPTDKPIVVGVDDSQASVTALENAFEFAALFCVEVIAVHAWTSRRQVGDVTISLLVDWNEVEHRHRTLLADALSDVRARYPQVPVTSVVQQGNPTKLIISQAHQHDAQMIVVGNRGRGRITGAALGSTSMNILHHASCPTLLCPTRTAARNTAERA